ncbi:hypothetical protein EST38_g5438 [Candolleomyces aberdarensis]|uniref:F-box domain-containing protein n=1 Tax=Candolleomyces aberdarensis TaxID=2316362 RepID=A0A4Q2DKG1_9AGAR|nr:hypothetical protein EST38_g5438 [Candolleomyces aberdarensis]
MKGLIFCHPYCGGGRSDKGGALADVSRIALSRAIADLLLPDARFRIRHWQTTVRDLVARGWSPVQAQKQIKPLPQSTVSIAILPAEILHQIFDQLDDDRQALAACSLVCKKWQGLSQPRLFHSIVLSTDDIEHSIQFQRFMLESPNIRAGIREVTVHFPDLSDWPRDRKLATNLMADVLELLPRPESLRLYGARFSDYRVKWSRLSNHFRNAIKTMLRRPTMTNLLIDGWLLDVNLPEFNAVFAGTSLSLTSVSLLDISDGLWGTSDLPQSPPSTRLQLEKLTVSNTFTKDFRLIEWLCKPESIFDLQNLKTLHIEESRNDSSVTMLAEAIGSSLESLEVNITDESIGLNHSTCLRSLSLNFGVFYTELYYSSIPWICDTLATAPLDSQIEDLSLSLYITHPRNTNTRVFPPPPVSRFNYDRWARLGAVLSSPKFSSLSRVTIQLIHHGIDARGYSAIAAQRIGDIGAKIVWKYLRDDSPDGGDLEHP